MSSPEIFFYIFSVLAVAFSLLVVLSKSPIHSAFSLVLVFFCVAADYVLLGAHLVATLQILVYAGAVMVLFIFVIMLLNADVEKVNITKNTKFQLFSGVLCLILLSMFVWGVLNGTTSPNKGMFTQEKIDALGGNTKSLSEILFSDYILPFELTSVLLLVGIIGTVSLAKRKLEETESKK